jgi:glycosyltransferase involved in cell wall biosynthesis
LGFGLGNLSCRHFGRQLGFYSVSLPLAFWIARHAREYDVVHVHSLFSFPSLAASFFSRISGVPYVIRPLGTLCRWGRQHRRPLLKKASLALIEKKILAGAAAIHYTSEQEKEEAADLGISRPAWVLANPVDRPAQYASLGRGHFRTKYPGLAGRPIILFLARLDPVKGLDLLLTAFKRVRERYVRAALVIAGQGDPHFESALRRQAEQLGITDSIIWAGFLDGESKWSALLDADVFVLPSYSENFGVAAVEAMCAGTPVVVSDRVGIHQAIQRAESGIVVRCDSRELADAITRLLDDPRLRARLSTNAKELATREFSADAVRSGLIRGYEALQSPSRTETATPFSPAVPAPQLSVVILTLNEERNLPSCLESLAGLNYRLFVVDSGSKDRTVEIATEFGATILTHPFENYSAQRNWSQTHLSIQTEWILHLDADERLTPELVAEINHTLASSPVADGFMLRKRTFFMGRWIRHGGHYPSYHLRLFRRHKGRCEQRLYDQHFLVDGEVARLAHDYIDIVAADIDTWTLRHARWAAAEAREFLAPRGTDQIRAALLGNPIERKRWLRQSVYESAPLFLRAFLYFVYRYIIRLGFLDRKQGLIFHFLQGCWFRLLVDCHIYSQRHSQENRPLA